jgi:hypothetical protein
MGPGCGKPLIRTRQQRRYAGGQIDADPFCGTLCCRRFHETMLPDTNQTVARRQASESSAARFRETT